MATVEVFDPAHPGASRQGAALSNGGVLRQRSADFCGTPQSRLTSVADLSRNSTKFGQFLARALEAVGYR